MTREEIVVGLDIGTTKVGTVIAASDDDGSLRVIGVGSVPSRGIKRGVVVDVEETVTAISESVERAAHMAGVKVEGAVAGVTGEHIESSNLHAAVTVAGRTGSITRFDVERVLQAAALEVPRDREIIHSLPRDFIVDGHPGVKRPIGMAGQRLEVETHIVTGRASFLQNAVQCVERAGLKVEALVLEPIATAEAVTTEDEREMGVILIDIGGGTSDLAVFQDGSITYSGVLPVGGNHVTRDIAIGLRTPFEIAEDLKIDSGAATRDMIPHGEALEIIMAGSGEQLRIPRALLGEIIEARMSELFELAREMMHQNGARQRLPGGVILSGGGALLPGAVELANAVFSMPVRLGVPQGVTGWKEQVAMPQFATGVGLCRFALTQRHIPGTQTAIPALASTEGRRIWGAIAPALPEPKVAPEQVSTEGEAKLAPKGSLSKAELKSAPPRRAQGFEAPRFEARPLPARPESARPIEVPDDDEMPLESAAPTIEIEAPAPEETPEPLIIVPTPMRAPEAEAPSVEPEIVVAEIAPEAVETAPNSERRTRARGEVLAPSSSPFDKTRDDEKSASNNGAWRDGELFRREDLVLEREKKAPIWAVLWEKLKLFLGFDKPPES